MPPMESNKDGLLFVRLYKPISSRVKEVFIYINDHKFVNWVFHEPYDEAGPVVYKLFQIRKEFYKKDSFKVRIKPGSGFNGFLGIKCIQVYTIVNK